MWFNGSCPRLQTRALRSRAPLGSLRRRRVLQSSKAAPLLLPTSSCPPLPCPQPLLPLPPTSPPNPTLQRPLPASAGTSPARRQPPHRVVGCRQSASPLLPLPQPPADALAALAPPPCVLPLHPLQFRTPPALPLPGPPHLLLPPPLPLPAHSPPSPPATPHSPPAPPPPG